MKVYVVECQGNIKIGLSADPLKRLGNMQTGCPFPMRLVASYDFGSRPAARTAEAAAHAEFAAGNIAGEWFTAGIDEVRSFLAAAGGEPCDVEPTLTIAESRVRLIEYLSGMLAAASDATVNQLAKLHGVFPSRGQLAQKIADIHVRRWDHGSLA